MTLGRALAGITLLATVLAAVVGAVYGAGDAALTWALLLGLGNGALVAAQLLAARRARIGGLRRQFGLAVAIAIGQLLVATAAAAGLMFVSAHDALFLLVVVALAGTVAVVAVQFFARPVMADLDALRRALVAVGEGERRPVPLPRSRDELAELAAAANTAIEQLAAAETAQRALVAAVSHDLRTPITSLKLLAAAVDDDIVDAATRRRYLAQMGAQIAALSGLIDDLFELSRLDAGDLRWSMERVQLDALVGEAVDSMRAQADAKRVQVQARVPAGLEPALGHPEKLQRVLLNLIQNAIHHTPADGSVTVLAEPVRGRLEIEVADSGEGIAATERERVFEPFFRGGAETARTRSGAGLGLAIARRIVEAHDGRIWLEDAADGTRVRFSLPAFTARGRPEAAPR